MPRILKTFICLLAGLLTACPKIPSASEARSASPVITPDPPSVFALPVEPAPAPQVAETVDAATIERRFLAANNDPDARIAAIRQLADSEPAVVLTALNRLFPLERREDVKLEILATLGDLDHRIDRDNQLALCIKALAPAQSSRVRYEAVHALGTLHDPRVRALLLPVTSDPDPKVRAIVAQTLRDLEP